MVKDRDHRGKTAGRLTRARRGFPFDYYYQYKPLRGASNKGHSSVLIDENSAGTWKSPSLTIIPDGGSWRPIFLVPMSQTKRSCWPDGGHDALSLRSLLTFGPSKPVIELGPQSRVGTP